MLLRILGTLLLLNLVVASAEAAIPTPIVKVDASTLTPGPLTSFANLGSQGGTFDAIGQQTPVVETVAGKKAITFNGMNAYRASFTSPDALTGANAWTVSTWIYNPTISSDSDFYFQWARRASSGEGDGHTASLVYNTQGVWGAADHYGNFAMNFGRLGAPAAAQWHNITITYDGANAVTGGSPVGTGTEIVYVDGVAVNVTVAKPLSLFTGTQMLLGSQELSFYAANTVQTPNNQNITGLTGSIASLQMFSGALSPDDVATLAGGATLQTGTVTDLIMNNSFENYTYGGRDRNSLDLGGYWYGFSYQGVDFYGTSTSNPNYATSGRTGTVGNQYTRQTKFPMLKPDGDHWNNGDNFDGYHVLAMEATYPTKSYVSQALFGIKPNTDYKVWGYFNARQVNAAVQNLELKIDGADILSPSPMQITAVDATKNTRVNPFTRVEANWHSNASASHWISIGSIGVQGNTYNGIACDKICIAEVGGPSKPVLSVKDLPKLTQLDFFGVAAGSSSTKTFRIFNDGGSAMQIISTNVIGADGFNYSATPASSTVAAFGGMTDISVTFSPTTAGTFNNAQLEIKTNSTATPILLLPLTGFSVPAVANGSFEQINQNTGGGDVQASYPGWTTNVLGSNDGNRQIGFTYNGQWKLDNGNLVDGRQGAELVRNTNDGTTTSMSQVVPGFVKNHTYRFRFYANSFKGTTSNAYDGKVWSDFKINGASAQGVAQSGSVSATVNFPTNITNREAGGTRSKAYDKYEFDWTAPDNGAYPIEFDAVGDAASDSNNALLLDNVSVFDKAVAGPATVSTTRLDFGNRTFNTTATLNVTVYNAGGKDLKVTTATTISGGQAGAFGITTILPLNVPYGGNASVTVKYLNTSYGQKDSTLTLSCDSGEKFIIALTANTSFSAYYPVVTNGSFDDTTANKPTDVNNNDNANGKWSVPGSSKSGRSWSGSLYNNNGVDPDGKAAMWVRKGTGTDDTTYTIYQDVSGFRAGRTYRVSLFANASANYAGFNGIAASALPVSGQAHLVVALSKTDNTSPVNLVDTTVNAVNAANVFTTNWPSFTADYTVPANFNGTLRLAIRAGKSSGDDALLFDGVKIQEVAPSIQAAPTSVRFNTVNWYKNDKPSTATITITNAGLNALNFPIQFGTLDPPGMGIVDTQFYNAPQFSIVSATPANKATLAPGESVSVVVKFNPTKKGNYTAAALLRVTSNDPNLPTVDIPLIGDAVPVELSTFSAE